MTPTNQSIREAYFLHLRREFLDRWPASAPVNFSWLSRQAAIRAIATADRILPMPEAELTPLLAILRKGSLRARERAWQNFLFIGRQLLGHRTRLNPGAFEYFLQSEIMGLSPEWAKLAMQAAQDEGP